MVGKFITNRTSSSREHKENWNDPTETMKLLQCTNRVFVKEINFCLFLLPALMHAHSSTFSLSLLLSHVMAIKLWLWNFQVAIFKCFEFKFIMSEIDFSVKMTVSMCFLFKSIPIATVNFRSLSFAFNDILISWLKYIMNWI